MNNITDDIIYEITTHLLNPLDITKCILINKCFHNVLINKHSQKLFITKISNWDGINYNKIFASMNYMDKLKARNKIKDYIDYLKKNKSTFLTNIKLLYEIIVFFENNSECLQKYKVISARVPLRIIDIGIQDELGKSGYNRLLRENNGESYFNIYCIGDKFMFHGRLTTVAQLNFFKWYLRNSKKK